jgi:hypothetical protein
MHIKLINEKRLNIVYIEGIFYLIFSSLCVAGRVCIGKLDGTCKRNMVPIPTIGKYEGHDNSVLLLNLLPKVFFIFWICVAF